MRKYVAKRIIHGGFVMWLVATVLFGGLRVLPGGPVRTMLGKEATPDRIETLRQQLGLNRPLPVQYVDWLSDLLVLDLGDSLTSGESVNEILLTAAPKTFSIGLVAIAVGVTLGLLAGIVSAVQKDQLSDYVATFAAFFGLSVPAFFIGIVLAVVFAVQLRLFPTFGYVRLSDGVVPWLRHLVLPGIAVGLPYAAILMRITRSSLLEVQGAPYMQTAYAKGLDGRTRLFKHAIPNALLPVVTVAGIQVAIILVGSVTVELVFGIQGLGRVLVNSILVRNYTVVQGVILLIAAIMISINLVVDILYTFLDPRIRYGGQEG